MRRQIKLYSYHTFLVIPFIVLFLYGNNPGQTSPEMTWRTLLIGAAVSVILFGLLYLFIRRRLKTGVLVTVILFALFQYGVVYEFFERLYYQGSWPFSNIHRYLLFLYFLFFTGMFLFIKYSKHDFIRINYFLNILITLLIIFNLVKINSRHIKGTGNTALTPADSIKPLVFSNAPKNDIFYIILDGYASNKVLHKYFDFKNDQFTTRLKNLNFTFCDSAISNYYYTSRSLASTLNMRYLKPGDDEKKLLQENSVFENLKNNGYKIYHMYSGYAVTSSFQNTDSTIYIDGPNEFEKSLLKYTILRLDDLIGLFAHQRLKSQFIKMMDMAEIKSTPKFCFMHFVAPHPPYIFHRDGRIRTRHRFAEHSWEPKEFYIDQLIYVNTQISKLINRILTLNANSIIIIQSDHGPWITANSPEKVFEARSTILYAVHAPAKIRFPQKTSSVNTFRHLFNGLFDTGLELITDEPVGKKALYGDPLLLKKIK